MAVITAKFLPQLFAYEDENAKRILRNLKKIKISNEYRLVDLGITEYVSIAKLDQKAFRYIEKNGKLYLRESVTSVGGLVQDSALINLGDFTIGDDETGAELEYLVRVKDAKAKQRAQQLRECERIAYNTLQRINKQVKNAELLQKWQDELQEAKRFVRLGKEDYYQSQVAIIAKFAKQDETLAKILVDYDTKINDKNQKWLTQPLKLPKVKDAAQRIGTAEREGIGELDPQRRVDFEKYYATRAPQMTPYLQSKTEVKTELAPAPEIIYDKQVTTTTQNTTATTIATSMAPQVEPAPQPTKIRKAQVSADLSQLKHAFNYDTKEITTGTTNENDDGLSR